MSGEDGGGPARQPAVIGAWTATALVVGNTIGASIFVLPAALAPFGYDALLGWVLTAIGCLAIAAVLARLARRYPEAVSPYDYLRRTLGPGAAFLALWAYWASVLVGNATIVTAMVGYLPALAPDVLADVPPLALALAAIWGLTAVNLAGVKAGGGVQIVTTALKLLPMAAILALGAAVAITRPIAFGAHPPATPVGFAPVGAAMSLALFAMLGLESAAIPAGRVRDPARTIPRATLLGTTGAAAIYLAVSTIALMLIPQGELARSAAPFSLLLDRFAGGGGALLAAFIVVSGLGTLNGYTLLLGELTRSLAADGYLPGVFSRVNQRGAAHLALLATAALVSVILTAAYDKSLVKGFAFLSLVSTAANLPLYLGAAASLAIAVRRESRRAVPIALALVGGVFCLAAFAGAGLSPLAWLFALLAAGAPLYWLRRRREAPREGANR